MTSTQPGCSNNTSCNAKEETTVSRNRSKPEQKVRPNTKHIRHARITFGLTTLSTCSQKLFKVTVALKSKAQLITSTLLCGPAAHVVFNSSKPILRNAQHLRRLSGIYIRWCQTQSSHEQSRTTDEQIVRYLRTTYFVFTLYSTTTRLKSAQDASYDITNKIQKRWSNLSDHISEQKLSSPLLLQYSSRL